MISDKHIPILETHSEWGLDRGKQREHKDASTDHEQTPACPLGSVGKAQTPAKHENKHTREERGERQETVCVCVCVRVKRRTETTRKHTILRSTQIYSSLKDIVTRLEDIFYE